LKKSFSKVESNAQFPYASELDEFRIGGTIICQKGDFDQGFLHISQQRPLECFD